MKTHLPTRGQLRNARDLLIVWWDAQTQEETISTVPATFPTWDAVLKWAEAQPLTPLAITARHDND
jgi:hypothetical protein